MANLTTKQELFVQGLLSGLSQRQAYKQAYDTSNTTDNVIDVRACELLKNSKVSVRYEELSGKVRDEMERKTIADAVEVMEFYSDLMRGKVKDISISYDKNGDIKENEIRPTLKERVKAADALAKKYGLDKKTDLEQRKVEYMESQTNDSESEIDYAIEE